MRPKVYKGSITGRWYVQVKLTIITTDNWPQALSLANKLATREGR